MWEEHPEYQKAQAKMIGLIVLAVLLLYLGFAIMHRDWDLLKTTLKVAAALIIALGILSGSAWLLVRFFTRLGSRRPERKEPPNG
jgi:hypothetical protein